MRAIDYVRAACTAAADRIADLDDGVSLWGRDAYLAERARLVTRQMRLWSLYGRLIAGGN